MNSKKKLDTLKVNVFTYIYGIEWIINARGNWIIIPRIINSSHTISICNYMIVRGNYCSAMRKKN
jgi:hypothetical protein